jgi:hypothetical protein
VGLPRDSEVGFPVSSRPLLGLVAVNVGCLVMNLLQTGSFWFLWVSPAVLLLYVFHLRSHPAASARRIQPEAVPA